MVGRLCVPNPGIEQILDRSNGNLMRAQEAIGND